MEIQKSKNLFERSRALVPGGVHSPVRAFRGVGGTPRFIQSAQGVELRDVDGNRYTDYCMSWGPLIFGHQDPETHEAIQSALGRGWSYGTAEPYSLELAELITSSIPWVQKIRFVNSGTEAVMAALRLARAATGRTKILKFEGCYHGHVDSMLVKAGSGLAEMASPDSAGVSPTVAAETLVAPLNDLEYVEKIFQLHGDSIAAVILEPVPANNGLLLQTTEFLKGVFRSAKKAGSLVIFDEVITGFRVSFGGMAEVLGVEPDLVTYGKIIGGGFPVGAYGGRRDLMDMIAPTGPVYQAGTLSANPIAMTAGLTTLKKLKRDNPYSDLNKKTEKLAQSLTQAAMHAEFPVQIQNYSSLFWMILGEPKSTVAHGSVGHSKDIGNASGKTLGIPGSMVRTLHEIPELHKAYFSEVFHLLLDDGIYLAPSAFEVSFLSTAHQETHLDQLVHKVSHALKQVAYKQRT